MAKKVCARVATFLSDTVKNATIDLLVLLKSYNFLFFSFNVRSNFSTVY